MEQGSAGLYLEVDHEDGRLHRSVYRPTLHAKVYTQPHHSLLVEVSDTGRWMVSEVRPRGRTRIIARGWLPSSRYSDTRTSWDPRR
jgi:hypothetical protein